MATNAVAADKFSRLEEASPRATKAAQTCLGNRIASVVILLLLLLSLAALPRFLPSSGVLAPRPTPEVALWGDLCGLVPDEIEEAMSAPHGWVKGERRYWVEHGWHTFEQAQIALMRKSVEDVCMLLAVEGQLPCPHRRCLLTLHTRSSTTDMDVLSQVFETFQFTFLLDFHPSTILDAGSNAGYTALMLAVAYPNATIVAVEPDARNLAILHRNLHTFPNVHVVEKGLFDAVGEMVLVTRWDNRDLERWAFHVKPVSKVHPLESGPHINTTTVNQILLDHGLSGFDFIKMDIEGAECNVLEWTADKSYDPSSWLKGAQMLSIEVHDFYCKMASKVVTSTMDVIGWKLLQHSGELKIYVNGDKWQRFLRELKVQAEVRTISSQLTRMRRSMGLWPPRDGQAGVQVEEQQPL